MAKDDEASREAGEAILNTNFLQLEEVIKKYGINSKYCNLLSDITLYENLTLLDVLINAIPERLNNTYTKANPTGLKNISYIELLLARGAIAPTYEEHYNDNIWYKRDVSPSIKAKYFTNKILNDILNDKLIDPELEMYGDQNTIMNRLKYLISEFEPAQYKKQIANLINKVTDNLKKNELKFLQDRLPDLEIKKFLDYKKITFDQIARLDFEYSDLKFETKYNENMYLMKLIKDKYFSSSSPKQHEEYAKYDIDIKFLALAKRLCEGDTVISASLINIYFWYIDPKIIIKAIDENYFQLFKFSNVIKNEGNLKILPDEVKQLIFNFAYSSNIEKLIEHFPYQDYFDSDEYKVFISGEQSI